MAKGSLKTAHDRFAPTLHLLAIPEIQGDPHRGCRLRSFVAPTKTAVAESLANRKNPRYVFLHTAASATLARYTKAVALIPRGQPSLAAG